MAASGERGGEEAAFLLDFLRTHHAPCPLCGYDLYQQTEARCPECGRAMRLAIFYYWGIYVLIGFPMVNFLPQYSALFFGIGTLVGIVFSGITARLHFARVGEVDVGERIRGGIHWVMGMVVAVAVPIILANMKMISGDAAGQFSCILVGVVYLMAGIHIDRPFFWMGLLLIVGGTCLGLVPGYGWTVLGVLLGVSLLVTGMLGTPSGPMGMGRVCGAAKMEKAAG